MNGGTGWCWPKAEVELAVDWWGRGASVDCGDWGLAALTVLELLPPLVRSLGIISPRPGTPATLQGLGNR